jgi:hypothetical protein
MRFEVLGRSTFEIEMHVLHGCPDARVPHHHLNNARFGAAVNGVCDEGVPVLVRRNSAADNPLANSGQDLPHSLSGEWLPTKTNKERPVVGILSETRSRYFQVQPDRRDLRRT